MTTNEQNILRNLGITERPIACQRLASVETAVGAIDDAKLLENATNAHRTSSLAYKTQQLERFNAAKAQIEGWSEHYTQHEIEDFIKKNPHDFFDTHGMNETQIKAEAKRIANNATRDSLLSHYENQITSAKNSVESSKTSLERAIKGHWDKTAKAFKSTAPKELQNAISHTGGGKMKLFAGLAAGATFLYNWLGGKNS